MIGNEPKQTIYMSCTHKVIFKKKKKSQAKVNISHGNVFFFQDYIYWYSNIIYD